MAERNAASPQVKGLEMDQALETAYRKAWQQALVVPHPAPDPVRAEGRDRLDLLQRMSTNEVLDLAPGEVRPTVLTTAIGRIVDLLLLAARPDDLLLLTSPGRGQAVVDWLHKYIFFRDQVRLFLEPLDGRHIGIYGPRAGEVFSALFDAEAPAAGRLVEWTGGFAWGVSGPGPGGIRVLLGAARDIAGANDAEPGAAEAYQALRIEAGLPEPDKEIQQDAIPLEVGLWDAVSFRKGCYIGQEIIARMESRGRLAKRLAGVELSGPAAPGAALRQGGAQVGMLTSAARSPRLGWIGLGVVRPSALETEGGAVSVGEQGTPGKLVELPFPAAE